MKKQSAGILLYKRVGVEVHVLLVHPGGPFWAKKDTGAWSIPKGEFREGEEPLVAAKREFAEELGTSVPDGALISLGEAKQAGGKIVHAWACQADFTAGRVKSNTLEMEWPPRSGKKQTFPEVDKSAWFSVTQAQIKIVTGQIPLIAALMAHLEQTMPAAEDAQPETPQQTRLL